MSDLFRQEALDNRRERLWGEVVLVQPLSFWLLTGFISLVVLLIALLLVFGTYARRENVTGYLLPDKGLIKITLECLLTIIREYLIVMKQLRVAVKMLVHF